MQRTNSSRRHKARSVSLTGVTAHAGKRSDTKPSLGIFCPWLHLPSLLIQKFFSVFVSETLFVAFKCQPSPTEPEGECVSGREKPYWERATLMKCIITESGGRQGKSKLLFGNKGTVMTPQLCSPTLYSGHSSDIFSTKDIVRLVKRESFTRRQRSNILAEITQTSKAYYVRLRWLNDYNCRQKWVRKTKQQPKATKNCCVVVVHQWLRMDCMLIVLLSGSWLMVINNHKM